MAQLNFPDLGPRFVIVEKLDEGGMAAIFLGKDTELGRDVAIKLLKYTSDTDEAQIRNEVQIMLRLQHPNIVQVFDVGKSRDNRPFIVMERLRGKNLARYLQELAERRLPPRQGLEFARQLCRALVYADLHKVYHRDISARNIFVCDTGELKLLDFGTSRVREATMTVTPNDGPRNKVALTLPYAAPEDFDSRQPVSDRLRDIYAFGVVLYEIFTGQRPFQGPAEHVLVARIMHATPTPPRNHASAIPRSLQRVILTAMARNPAHRYRSFSVLLTKLELVHEGITRFQLTLLGSGIIALLIVGFIAGRFYIHGGAQDLPAEAGVSSLATMTSKPSGPLPREEAVPEDKPKPIPEDKPKSIPEDKPLAEIHEPKVKKPAPSASTAREEQLQLRVKAPIKSAEVCKFALSGEPPWHAMVKLTIDAQGTCLTEPLSVVSKGKGTVSEKMLQCAKAKLCTGKFSTTVRGTNHVVKVTFSP